MSALLSPLIPVNDFLYLCLHSIFYYSCPDHLIAFFQLYSADISLQDFECSILLNNFLYSRFVRSWEALICSGER